MAEVFQEFSSLALSKAIDDNLIAKSLSFPRFFGGKILGPNPLWFITGQAMKHNNGVARANFSAEMLDRDISTTLEPFKAQNLPVVWWVGPTSSPGNLGTYLQRSGFTHNRDMIGLAIDLHKLQLPPSSPSDLIIERVTNKAMLAQWYDVILQCFPISFNQDYFDALAKISLRQGAEWIHYVGCREGNIVSASSLYLGGGVAGLYNLGTLPLERGHGIGTQMTVNTFHQARDMGYRVGTLQTTYPNALRMYHRLGFEVYCKIGIYRKAGWNGKN